MRRFWIACLIAAGCGAWIAPGFGVFTTRLEPKTVASFDAYVQKREQAMERRGRGAAFLWSEESAARAAQLKSSGVVVDGSVPGAVVSIPDGLIHDWSGAAFLPGATLESTLAVLQDYNNHKEYFQPEVIDSRLKWREGDRFRPFLRLRKEKILTVVLNTDYEVTYERMAADRVFSKSYSTRIAELEGERERPPGDDHGFLWRLYAYWRLQQKDGGTYVECESISLSRPIPALLRGVITPIVRELPRESLEKTLLNIRRHVKPADAARLR